MAISKTRFRKGVTVVPDTDALEGIEGEIKVDSADGKLKATLGGSARELLTNSQSATLTNKTFDADGTGNSITNIENADIKAAAAIDASKIADGSVSSTEFQYINSLTSNAQTQINTVSSAAGTAQTDINNHIADAVDAHDASAISSIPSGNLAATEVQAALNELQTDVDTRALASDLTNHINDAVDAHDASAISNIPSGNLAATEVQAALNELQTDVDTRALNSDLTTHTGASTGVHGVTGSVVGTSDSQVLTNKTITGADFRTPLRSDVKQDTKANLTTYALTASNGQLVFATDTKEMFQVVDTLLVAVGSGGVGNVDALLTQTFDTAALADFTQTGLALVTSNTINGAVSARLIHQPSSSQSFKQIKAVDRKYRGELMQLSLQVRSSASEGNLTLLVTDETNSAVIAASQSIQTSQYQVATAVTNGTTTVSGFSNVDINTLKVGMTITGSGIPTATVINSINTIANTIVISQAATASATITAKFSALPDLRTFSFTIPTNCASLSYTITALQEAGLPESYVDDVVIQLANTALLSTSVVVPVMTEWQGYTPAFTGFGTATSVEFEWRQVGENVEVRGKFTSGTSTAVEARVGLPAGLTSAGTSLIPSIQIIGRYGTAGSFGNSVNGSGNILIEPSVTHVTFSGENTAGLSITKQNGNAITSVTTLSFFASVPCAGLSATTTKTIALTQSGLIQDADSMIRLDTANGFGSVATKIRRFTNIRQNIGSDILYQDSATNGASFTAITSGVYSVSFTDCTTATATIGLSLNSSQLTTNIFSITPSTLLAHSYIAIGTASTEVSWAGYLNAGDIIRPHTEGVAAGSTPATFTMSRQGSLKQVRVNTNSKITIPTSELRFEGASSRGAVATAIVKFDTLAKIRGDAFTVTNTANDGTFVTMLKAGRLNISMSLTSGSACRFDITKNQAVLTALSTTASEILASEDLDSGTSRGSASWSGDVNVGDVFRVDMSVAPSANSTNNLNLAFQEQDIAVSVTNVLPQFSESDSSVRVDTANGYGSTGTKIRRFSNVRDNIGVDVEYADSAANGASFTAKTSGTYNISYSDIFSAAGFFGISKNSGALSTNASNQVTGVLLANTLTAAANFSSSVSVEAYLIAGDVIRPHTDGTGASASPAFASFTMSKVGKPNVTGVNVTPFVNMPNFYNATNWQSYVPTFTNLGTLTSVLGCEWRRVGDSIQIKGRATLGTTVASTASISLPMGYITTSTLSTQLAGTWSNNSDSINRTRTLLITPSSSSLNFSAANSINPESGTGVGSTGQIISWFSDFIPIAGLSSYSDQILTAPETFSTDTAPLTYAGSGTYTLATLANAPVGTFITFTYAINTNTRTQTTTAPTQTTADMNANGIQISTAGFNTATTAAAPAVVSIQIGKGLKGTAYSLYKNTGKSVSGVIDLIISGSNRSGADCSYNEVSGILTIDARYDFMQTSTNAGTAFRFSDATLQGTGYLVINASKNPALTGFGLNRIAARGISSSGQSILTGVNTTVLWDANKVFDTTNSLNAATGIYTASETGYYQVNANVTYSNITTQSTINTIITKNGAISSLVVMITQNTAASYGAAIADCLFLSKGDTVSIQTNHNTGSSKTLNTSGNVNFFSIVKVSV